MGLPANYALRGVAEPTTEEVMCLVEPADTGGHWYWLGDVVRDGIDPVPVLRRDGCTWVVIRLLLPCPRGRVRRVNRCGLRTCVNPGHWAVVVLEDGVVLTDFDGAGWRRA
jgi:hypothetical protein